jgi:lactoylglutathione lyase
MKIEKHGIILNVEKFDECVAFYKDLFKLSEMFSKVEDTFRLTCLEFGDSYLMIETEGVANPSGKDVSQCPTKLRFNVLDIHNALECVREYGVDAEIILQTASRFSLGSLLGSVPVADLLSMKVCFLNSRY